MKPIQDFVYPRNGKCPICKKSIKDRQLIMNFGVMKKTAEGCAQMIEDKENPVLHMSIMYHNSSLAGEGHLEIANWVHSSQADWMFCSSKCFKKFFSNMADELDKRDKKARKS